MVTNEKDDERHIVTLKVNEFTLLIKNIVSLEINKFKENLESKENIEDEKLMPRLKVAKMFGISSVSLDKWKKSGILPPPIKMAGKVYYLRKEIIDLIKSRKESNYI